MRQEYVRPLLAVIVPLGILAALFLIPAQEPENKSAPDSIGNAAADIPPPEQQKEVEKTQNSIGIAAAKIPPPPQKQEENAGKAGEYRGSLAGHIVRPDRQPVPGITVELIRIADAPLDGKELADLLPLRECPKQQTLTDAQGGWRFDNLPAGHYGIKAETKTELATDDMPMRVVTENDGPDTFVGKSAVRRMEMSPELRPAFPLAGQVIGPDGQPAAGAEIYPYRQEAGAPSVSVAESYMLGQKCENNGTFFFPKLKSGLWQFAVSVNGGPPEITDWFSTGEREAEIRLGAARRDQMPDIVAKTLSGEVFRLSSLRGKYVLLDFWATWCGPCRAETPSVKAAYEAFKNDQRLVMVGLSLDNDPEAPKKYVAENGMGWTQAFLGNWDQANIPAEYKVDAIPQIMLLDPEGKVLARDLRGPAIRETVGKCLGSRGNPAAVEEHPVSESPNPQSPKTISASLTPSKDGTGAMKGTLDLNIDRDFQYGSGEFPMGLSAGQSDAPPCSTRPVETLSKEPAYHSANVFYGYLQFGNTEDNKFTFAIDDFGEPTWMGYFDRNNNEDLTDDGPPAVISSMVEFDVSIVLASGETVHRPYKIWQWGNSESRQPGLRFYSTCYHRAEVDLNGTRVTAIAFERFKQDALYKDDGIWLDLNGDYKMDEKTECFETGGTFTVNDQAYQVNLDYP